MGAMGWGHFILIVIGSGLLYLSTYCIALTLTPYLLNNKVMATQWDPVFWKKSL